MTNQISITYKRLNYHGFPIHFLSVVIWLNLKVTDQHNIFRIFASMIKTPGRAPLPEDTLLTGGTGSTAIGALVQRCPTAHWDENMGHWKM